MGAIPFDAALLDGYRTVLEAGSGPMSLERLSKVRAEDAAEVPTLDELRQGGRFEVTTHSVPGASGTPEAELLICTPAAVSDLAASRPVIYFVHGGGYFSGDPQHLFFLEPLLDEAERLGASLISAGYRLAPEHPYPAPLDDVYAGLLWTAEHAADLGLDADRIVVAGTSAGGGLAAALSLSVRDKGGPRLVGQLLMCPMLDDRNDSASAHQMDGVDVWDRSWNGFGWKALLGSECGARTCRLTPHPPAPRSCPDCHPPSSTSAPRRRCATRPSPTPTGSGGPVALPSCMCGPAATTRSTWWSRTR